MVEKKVYDIKFITEDVRIMTYKFFIDLVKLGIVIGGISYIVEKL
jgi:hypothetical protein